MMFVLPLKILTQEKNYETSNANSKQEHSVKWTKNHQNSKKYSIIVNIQSGKFSGVY